MSNALKLGALLLVFGVPQWVGAFEGDYIWDERFKAGLAKARAGQMRDQYAVGDMYFRGRGTTTNHTKALHWFLLAAKQGHRKSAYKAGYLYLYGEGLTHSSKQAFTLFRQSAIAGYVPAQYELGKLFLSGAAGQRDNTQALKWLGKAKAANYALAEDHFTQAVSRLMKSGAPSPGASSSSLSLAALDKKRAQPTVVDAPDPKRVILHSKWDSSEGPSIFLPSTLTSCRANFMGIECVSTNSDKQLAGSREGYRTRTHITDIQPDGQFRLAYANNAPSADVDTVSTTSGRQRIEHVLACSLVAGRVISCAQGTQKQYRFFGSEKGRK